MKYARLWTTAPSRPEAPSKRCRDRRCNRCHCGFGAVSTWPLFSGRREAVVGFPGLGQSPGEPGWIDFALSTCCPGKPCGGVTADTFLRFLKNRHGAALMEAGSSLDLDPVRGVYNLVFTAMNSAKPRLQSGWPGIETSLHCSLTLCPGQVF